MRCQKLSKNNVMVWIARSKVICNTLDSPKRLPNHDCNFGTTNFTEKRIQRCKCFLLRLLMASVPFAVKCKCWPSKPRVFLTRIPKAFVNHADFRCQLSNGLQLKQNVIAVYYCSKET